MSSQFQGRLGARRGLIVLVFLAVAFFLWRNLGTVPSRRTSYKTPDIIKYIPSTIDYSKTPVYHKPDSIQSPPIGRPKHFPKVQSRLSSSTSAPASSAHNDIAQARKQTIKTKFLKSWDAYKTYAWTKDELMPLSGRGKQSLSGWSAQLVDALDTLWIMGLKEEFHRAVKEVATIDWSKSSDRSVNMFEVTIRYLGGLLAAYELSEERSLLAKAIELGEFLYTGFDTPNRMPPRWLSFEKTKMGLHEADLLMSSAAGGSLCLEFTRLTQLTGDPKYYDATERIKQFLYRWQNDTRIPGLWPTDVNFRDETMAESMRFSLGAGADSLYEYLPKMHALLGGLDPQYEVMTVAALDAAKNSLLFKPMTPTDANILLVGEGSVSKAGKLSLTAEMQHLTCFAGGMYALAGKLLARDDYLDLGSRLTSGCVWIYDAFSTNVMPEIVQLYPCNSLDGECPYSRQLLPKNREKTLPDGIVRVRDPRYLLRPEAIESVFYMWRITGEQVWRDTAWRMWQGIVKETETEIAFASIEDVKMHASNKLDSMEVSSLFCSTDVMHVVRC
jgi:mannosyl-oligosaccharide alpha-1,2-mannosidase